MRILLVNDDGPPGPVSPYFAPFEAALRLAGHTVTVVIPDRPLSWIGKAHAVGKTLSARAICPVAEYGVGAETGVPVEGARCPHAACAGTSKGAEDPSHHWLVVDGPPASCVQLGLFHRASASPASPSSSSSPPPFDLVISGPNHGRNASTIYALSSGTVGAAMEAAQCGVRAVALSFGSKALQPTETVLAACGRAVAVVEALAGADDDDGEGNVGGGAGRGLPADGWAGRRWRDGVEVYSVNVPMRPDVGDAARTHAVWTRPAPVRWSVESGGLFKLLDADDGSGPVAAAAQVNGHGGAHQTNGVVAAAKDASTTTTAAAAALPSYRFKWQPELSDVRKRAAGSVEGEDLWASEQGYVGITALKANFEVVG